jgi:hypothetical protein
MTIMYKNVFQSLASELGQAKHSFKRRADNTFHTTRVAVHLMMPVYHTSDNALSEEDFYVVADSWKCSASSTRSLSGSMSRSSSRRLPMSSLSVSLMSIR